MSLFKVPLLCQAKAFVADPSAFAALTAAPAQDEVKEEAKQPAKEDSEEESDYIITVSLIEQSNTLC